MSKQLLYTYKSSVVTVGLNDRAFVLINNNDDDSSTAAIVLELMVNKDTSVDATKVKSLDDTKVDDKETTKVNEQQQSEKKKKKNPPQPTNNPHEIQAVCCTQLNNSTIFVICIE